jgi:hypothetical protein
MCTVPHIERVQVEEGFWDGLDIESTPGLHVSIGARGTGKPEEKTDDCAIIPVCRGFGPVVSTHPTVVTVSVNILSRERDGAMHGCMGCPHGAPRHGVPRDRDRH